MGGSVSLRRRLFSLFSLTLLLVAAVAVLGPRAYAHHLYCQGSLSTRDGSSGNDTITGTNATDVVRALAGDDIVQGLDGPDLLCAAPDPADEVAARMALDDALTQLSEGDREALLLVVWDGLDNRKAAVVMNCSPATFALRLHRARRRLTQQFHKVQANDRKPHAAARG